MLFAGFDFCGQYCVYIYCNPGGEMEEEEAYTLLTSSILVGALKPAVLKRERTTSTQAFSSLWLLWQRSASIYTLWTFSQYAYRFSSTVRVELKIEGSMSSNSSGAVERSWLYLQRTALVPL